MCTVNTSGGVQHRLTESELAHIRHALDAEMMAVKKCVHYAGEIRDHDAQSLLAEHQDIHRRRIEMMLSLLDSKGDITTEAKLLLQSGGDWGTAQ